MSTTRVQTVFISYAREDLLWAQEQKRILCAAGIDVYQDLQSNRAGDDWEERISQALESTDQVRLGWSRYAAQSEWVRREYTEALRLARQRGRKRFLLVDLLDETPLPPDLKHVHAERWIFAGRQAEGLLRAPHRTRSPGVTTLSELLNPELQVVPFDAREELLQRIEDWCCTESPFALSLYVGAGGSGKTRLLAQACVNLRARHWDVGFLDHVAAAEASPERLDELLHPRLPRLIVIDQAESRRDQVRAVLKRAVHKHSGPPVRVVLLARSAGDWWTELLDKHPAFAELLGSGAEPHRLAPLAPGPEQRRRSYEKAVQAFARALDRPVPRHQRSRFADPGLSQALFLHLAALLDVLGDPGAPPAELTRRMLGYEQLYWEQAEQDVGLENELGGTVAAAVAMVTVVGGVEQGEPLDALLQRCPLFANPWQREKVSQVLVRLYGCQGRIEPLRPDRVGETLVGREMENRPLLRDHWHVGADAAQLRHGLRVLDHVAHERRRARGWLVQVLVADLPVRAPTALEVAMEGRRFVAAALDRAVRDHPGPLLARALEPRVPKETVVMRRLALTLTRQALEGDLEAAQRADLLNGLAMRLRDLGRLDDALQAARDALEIRRAIARSGKPDDLFELSTSLNSITALLRDLGEYEQALAAVKEAVRIRRALADGNPSFFRSLARSLNHEGITLRSLGHLVDALRSALESARIRTTLAQDEVGKAELAVSCNSMSVTLGQLGRHDDAREAAQAAVDLNRGLAETTPDKYRPRLAESLENLSSALEGLARFDEAVQVQEEAVDLYTRLAKKNRGAFQPVQAKSLDRLAALREVQAARPVPAAS